MPQDPGALYDFNLDEELEIDLDDEAMEAMFGQDLASENDILGMWVPEVLDWPTWVCVPAAGAACLLIAVCRPMPRSLDNAVYYPKPVFINLVVTNTHLEVVGLSLTVPANSFLPFLSLCL